MRALACDLDRTLMGEDAVLHERTRRALGGARDAGLHVIVVTGRMAQSLRRFLEPAHLSEPFICYQGAVVADADGTWLRHVPIPLDLAREAIAAVEDALGGVELLIADWMSALIVVSETPPAVADVLSSVTGRMIPPTAVPWPTLYPASVNISM